MKQNTSALSHPAANDGLSAQARSICEERSGIAERASSAQPPFIRREWIAVEVGQGGSSENPVPVYEVMTADGHERIAEHLHENDARRIVQCVNSHDDLLAALRDVIGWIPLGPGSWHTDAPAKAIERARAAIDCATS